jgi:hypothetical protein
MEKKTFEKSSILVFGILKNQIALDKTLKELKVEKYISGNISVLMKKDDMLAATPTTSPEAHLWLKGSRTVPVPDIGPIIAMGPIITQVAAVRIGSTRGGLENIISSFGFSESDAKNCEAFIKDDKIFIMIAVEDVKWLLRTKNILVKNGAVSINSTSVANMDSKIDNGNQIQI